jgi:hypothetical protein
LILVSLFEAILPARLPRTREAKNQQKPALPLFLARATPAGRGGDEREVSFFEANLKPVDPLPGTLPGELFFLATGIWPLSGRDPPRPDGRPYMLHEIAAESEYASVRAWQECVGGRWCTVLERPGYDRLWLDTDRGYALVARETQSKENGALVQRIELGEHREVVPGMWLPTWFRNIQFDYHAPTEQGRQRKVVNALHTVIELGVNDVCEATFEFHQLSGAIRTSREGSRGTQIKAGGLDHLENLVGWVRKRIGVGGQPRRTGLVYVAACWSAGLIAVWELFVRWRVGRGWLCNLRGWRGRCPQGSASRS